MPLDDRVIAISATFTAEAIQPGLAFWAGELGLDYEIRFAGYNQIFQQLLDTGELFSRNHGFNVALVRFQDWLTAGVEGESRRLADAVRSAAGAFSSPLILVVCPPTPQHAAAFEAAGRILREGVTGLAAVHLVEAADVLSLYPVQEVHDPHGEELGHLPYTPVFFVALATAVARKIHAIATPPFKVAALDCDETLWSGICGEDGPHGVSLDEPRRALQQFMADRRREGLLLAISSKNNEEDVVETFAAHPEFPLQLSDFAARRINWDAKGPNLASMAAELEVGLDTFLLVDDNPKECNEAQASAPEVLALPLPANPADIPEFLRHVWAFDRERITEEDRQRAAMYADRAERSRAEQAAGSLENFLASLNLEISIEAMQPSQVARVAQLTQRTNQMNMSLVRRTEAEIQSLDAECLTVSVKDRFGSYGLTGAAIFRTYNSTLQVDTFLLSCRVLGRGVEHRMVARLGEIARERGLSHVEIAFAAGQRNRPAALFLESIGSRLTADQAAAVHYTAAQPPTAAPAAPHKPVLRKRVDYLRIATELRDPTAIQHRIGASSRRIQPLRTAPDPPRTPLERELAEMWASLLNLPTVGVHENFFELGGHSLLAVQLLSRVRQLYSVDLSLEVVYSGDFTVAELGKAVELKEIEQSGADYQDLLKEIENLSDEEVRALLAQEQDAV